MIARNAATRMTPISGCGIVPSGGATVATCSTIPSTRVMCDQRGIAVNEAHVSRVMSRARLGASMSSGPYVKYALHRLGWAPGRSAASVAIDLVGGVLGEVHGDAFRRHSEDVGAQCGDRAPE